MDSYFVWNGISCYLMDAAYPFWPADTSATGCQLDASADDGLCSQHSCTGPAVGPIPLQPSSPPKCSGREG